ncbi:MAG TPA: ABC transporter transmembrane domain-containing protein [Candidatus Krumholzibacteria bacterium]|nr:ABC transporter transmembrane domain-containing protein [Candidatus Krumholzibacteria bacterium]
MSDPFRDAEEIRDDLAPPADLKRILGLARPYVGSLIAATSLMLIGTAIGLVTPRVAGGVVDAALVDGNLDRLNRIVSALIALFAALGVTTYVEHYVLRTTGARMLLDLRHHLFDHLAVLSPDFYENRPVGELLSRMGTDLGQVQASLTNRIPSGISAVLRFIGTLAILLVLQTKLTLVALIVVPPVVLLAVYFGRKLERLSQQERDATAAAGARAEETLSGIRTVQAFQREGEEVRRYFGKLRSLLGVQIRNAHVEGAFSGTVQFAAYSAFAVVMWYGGRLMLDGALTPGELTSFLLYTFSIAVSVGTLGSLYAAFRELRGSSARIFQLLDTLPTISDPEHPVPLRDARGELRLDHVDFAYGDDPERLALRDVDLVIEPGEVVGLVGPSGAGKSTVFNLLLRYHDPVAGNVQLDGIDLRHLRVDDVRRHIAVVPQDIFLMSGSIEENLRIGRLDASDDEIRRAAEMAGAAEFIERLPDGYGSEIGQRGVRLSGGQRQRLAIARAFLRDPTILLLDEATSALDPDSEQRVQEALTELMKGRTTLVIAHRLVTARRADRILVFDDGRIVASGTHDELYEANELYRRYWTLQSMQFQEGTSP